MPETKERQMVVVFWEDEPQFTIRPKKNSPITAGQIDSFMDNVLDAINESFGYDWWEDCGDLRNIARAAGLKTGSKVPIDDNFLNFTAGYCAENDTLKTGDTRPVVLYYDGIPTGIVSPMTDYPTSSQQTENLVKEVAAAYHDLHGKAPDFDTLAGILEAMFIKFDNIADRDLVDETTYRPDHLRLDVE